MLMATALFLSASTAHESDKKRFYALANKIKALRDQGGMT
jgi:hypothetical protein